MSADVGSAIWRRVLREVPRDKQSPSGNVRAGTEPTHVQKRTTVKSCLLSLSSASSTALGQGTLDTHVHTRAHTHTLFYSSQTSRSLYSQYPTLPS